MQRAGQMATHKPQATQVVSPWGFLSKKNHSGPGNSGPSQPPRKRVVIRAATVTRWAYSAIMKRANFMLLYSILNPQASSLSDSGISKGVLFISAKAATIYKRKAKG